MCVDINLKRGSLAGNIRLRGTRGAGTKLCQGLRVSSQPSLDPNHPKAVNVSQKVTVRRGGSGVKRPETFKIEHVDLYLMTAGGVNFKRENLQWNFIFSSKVFSLPLVSEDEWTDGRTDSEFITLDFIFSQVCLYSVETCSKNNKEYEYEGLLLLLTADGKRTAPGKTFYRCPGRMLNSP